MIAEGLAIADAVEPLLGERLVDGDADIVLSPGARLEELLVVGGDGGDHVAVGVLKIHRACAAGIRLQLEVDGADRALGGDIACAAEVVRAVEQEEEPHGAGDGGDVGHGREPEALEAALADDLHDEVDDRGEEQRRPDHVHAQQAEDADGHEGEHHIVGGDVDEGLADLLGLAADAELPCREHEDGSQEQDHDRPADIGREERMDVRLGGGAAHVRPAPAVDAQLLEHVEQIDQAADGGHVADGRPDVFKAERRVLVRDDGQDGGHRAGDQQVEQDIGVDALEERAAADRHQCRERVIEQHQKEQAKGREEVVIEEQAEREVVELLVMDERRRGDQHERAEHRAREVRDEIHPRAAREIREEPLRAGQGEGAEHIHLGLAPKLGECVDGGEHPHEHGRGEAAAADRHVDDGRVLIGIIERVARIRMGLREHDPDRAAHQERDAQQVEDAGDDGHLTVLAQDAQTVAEGEVNR